MTSFRSILQVFFFFIATYAFAQHKNISQSPIPAWVEETSPDFDAALPEEKATGFYYLLADKQEHLGLDESYRRFTFKVLNSTGIQSMSDLSIDFDPDFQQVSIHSINIIREGEVINKIDLDKIQVVQRETSMERKLYDGRLTIVANLTDVRSGDIIDYSYTIKGSSPVYQGKFSALFSLEFNIDVHQHKIAITVPNEEYFGYRLLYGAKEPQIDQTKDYSRYTWEDFDLQEKVYEENTPIWYEESPAVEISQFEQWSEVNELFLESFTLQENELRKLNEQVKTLFKNSTDEESFIKDAIRFVQDEVRYLGFENGTNAHIPTKSSAVFENRYGDCKDKSLLLSGILQSRGIKAYPVLVHSYNGRNLAETLPSPVVFDHCVVQIDLGIKGFKYIDPTINEQGGEIDEIYFPNYSHGLLIKSGTKDLTTLPEYTAPKINITETFELDSINGGAKLLVKTVFSGESADVKRRAFLGTSLEAAQKDYEGFYDKLYPGIQAEGQINLNDDRDKNEFTVLESYRIGNIWNGEEDNKNIISAKFYPLSMESFLYPEKYEDRKMPYLLDHSLDVVHKTIVYVPIAWNVNNEKRSVRNDYFKWDLDIRYKNATLEITHKYKTFGDHVAPGDLKQFLTDHSTMQQDLQYFLTFNNAVAGAAVANSVSWAAVLFMLVLMTGAGVLCFLIYRKYDLHVTVKAKNERKIGGWLVLLGIGLVFTPIMILSQLLSGNYFSSSIWISLFSSSETYTMAFLLGAELALYSLLLIFSLLVLVLFFQRRSIAPRMMIILYASNLIFSGILAFASIALHPEAFPGPERQDIYYEISKMAIRCLIIIPYLLYSTRVEETFTRTHRSNEEPEEEDFIEEISVSLPGNFS